MCLNLNTIWWFIFATPSFQYTFTQRDMSDQEEYKAEFDELESDYGDAEVTATELEGFLGWVSTKKRAMKGPQLRFPPTRETLPESTLLELTAKELHNLIHEGYIDLNPPYQRGLSLSWTSGYVSIYSTITPFKDPVWGKDKQSALIESIYKNYYVPPVVFSVQEDPESEFPLRVCMDGKQRLTSILSFFDGQVRWLTLLTTYH